ncbi:phosphodiester glycosidase family protein [Haloferula sp.]|uniref:phosphodiester glycosidase family protein n=1 Tax=Haloferula sp. TaxID=2497595 RepID=UPI0032A03984
MAILVIGLGVGKAAVVEEAIEHAGAKFRVVRLDPAKVELAWRGDDGKPYETFDRVQKAYASEGKKVGFLMNAGIFEPGLIPSGLYVEKGKELRPLNLKDGKGNFFLKPNGVFMIDKGGKARVVESKSRLVQTQSAEFAVQSGPLLLMDGKRHPAFRNGSPNLKHRNGVGIDGKGRIVFAMTDKRQDVVFWDFAGLFLKLGCKDALFLDGDISQMAVNPEGPTKSNRFAAMFVVVE